MITLLMKNKLQREKAFSIMINKDSLLFAEITGHKFMYAPIEGLNLNIRGILEEFPELASESPSKIKKESIKRFKEKLKKLYGEGSEKAIRDYVIEDLKKHGYYLIKEVVSGPD